MAFCDSTLHVPTSHTAAAVCSGSHRPKFLHACKCAANTRAMAQYLAGDGSDNRPGAGFCLGALPSNDRCSQALCAWFGPGAFQKMAHRSRAPARLVGRMLASMQCVKHGARPLRAAALDMRQTPRTACRRNEPEQESCPGRNVPSKGALSWTRAHPTVTPAAVAACADKRETKLANAVYALALQLNSAASLATHSASYSAAQALHRPQKPAGASQCGRRERPAPPQGAAFSSAGQADPPCRTAPAAAPRRAPAGRCAPRRARETPQ